MNIQPVDITGPGVRDRKKLFKAQFKKFPELKEIYENIDEYTLEEIDALEHRKWIKQELKQAKQLSETGHHPARQFEAQSEAERLAQIMREASQGI